MSLAPRLNALKRRLARIDRAIDKYSPDQSRDEQGRWSSEGGGSGGGKAPGRYNETVRAASKLKSLMPSGSKSSISVDRTELSWRKSGGHAGRSQLDKAVDKLRAVGFKLVASVPNNTADGSYMGTIQEYRDQAGNTARASAVYGPTKEYNSFSLTVNIWHPTVRGGPAPG